MIGEATLEAVRAHHGLGEKARAGDMSDPPVPMAGQVAAHRIAASEVVGLDGVHGAVRQVAHEDRRHVDPQQGVLHPVQGEVADDQPIDAQAADAAQILAAVFLRVPAGHVAVEDHRVEAPGLECSLRRQDKLGIERIGDVRNQDRDHVGLAGAKAPGVRVGDVAELGHRLQDSGAQRLRDAVSMVQDMRDRGPRDAGTLRDLGNRGHSAS